MAKLTKKQQEAKAELKAFWVQYPTAARIFWEIFKVWKTASSRIPNKNGYWAAWPYPWWSERLGIPASTLKWNLNLLEKHSLIERKRARHSGTRVLTFMRPTNEALTTSEGDDRLWHHLNKQHFEPKLEPSNQLFKPQMAKPKSPLKPKPEEEKITSLEQLLGIIGGDGLSLSVS